MSRSVVVVVLIVVVGFGAGTLAAALPYSYGDFGPCPVEGYGDGRWRWFPFGYACPDFAERTGSASVAGSLVAAFGAIGVLLAGWRLRAHGWARGAAAGVLMLAVAGAFGTGIGAPAGWVGTFAWAPGVAFGAFHLLTPKSARHLEASVLFGLASLPALVVALAFVVVGWWPLTAVGLVLGVAATAGAGRTVARRLRPRPAPEPV